MSSAGRVVSSNGCVIKPKGRETGLQSCSVQIRSSSLTGSYVMEMAEQREPYESRGSRTVLGEPRGESPRGHSTIATPCYDDTSSIFRPVIDRFQTSVQQQVRQSISPPWALPPYGTAS